MKKSSYVNFLILIISIIDMFFQYTMIQQKYADFLEETLQIILLAQNGSTWVEKLAGATLFILEQGQS